MTIHHNPNDGDNFDDMHRSNVSTASIIVVLFILGALLTYFLW